MIHQEAGQLRVLGCSWQMCSCHSAFASLSLHAGRVHVQDSSIAALACDVPRLAPCRQPHKPDMCGFA
jgi:hypothetical protein